MDKHHSDQAKFLGIAVGIFFCYFYYGVMQEKVTRGRYGTDENPDGTVGERYTLALALVAVQCICNWAFAKALLTFSKPAKRDDTSTLSYASCSLTYLLAMVSSNMALQWVPYPTQVVGKSAKPIPVMLLGVLIGHKSYALQKYLFVLLIVVGVALFMFKDSKAPATNSATPGERSFVGELLLILSLSMDGLTGAIQERMRASSAPTGKQMMLAMNWWSSVMLVGILLVTGEGVQFVAFVQRHPEVLGHLGGLALAGAFGQLFIFLMVSGYGPLPCSVVTTTRKFFTVLFSVMFYGNSLTGRQWYGTVLVFAGLFADMYWGKKRQAPGKVKLDPSAEKLIK